MGSRRVCGLRCHCAQRPKCVCWCGGIFHGAAGELAREAFAAEYGLPPRGEKVDDPRWDRAVGAAKRAHGSLGA